MVDMNALSHIILFYHVIFFTPPPNSYKTEVQLKWRSQPTT